MNAIAFINSIKGQAVSDMRKFGVLASLTISQSILESGWGETALAAQGNNLFGIKANGWTGAVITLPTNEYYNGVKQTINADFRKYPSWAESISDHTKLLMLPRYANILWLKDYKQVCHLVQQDGYATDPAYADKLIQLIEQYKLYEYDQDTAFKPLEVNNVVSEFQGLCNSHGFTDDAGQKLKVDGDFGQLTGEAAPTIKKGSSLKDFVMLLQKQLKKFGYYLGAYGPNKDGIDGDFGNTTLTAIVAFQRSKGLVADGIVGPKTWKALLS